MLRKTAIALAVAASAAALTSLPAQAAKPVVTGHETLSHGMAVRGAHAASHGARPTRSNNLTYHGGAVNTTPRVFIIFWGSQWGPGTAGALPDAAHDTAQAVPLQLSFFQTIGDDSWVTSTRQYCAGVAVGATSCPGYTAGWSTTNLVAGHLLDNGATAPSRPTQSQLAAEAAKVAASIGYPADVQYIVDTASGNNASGFGTQYCAWHSSTASNGHQIAYTNMPYVADAGSSCGSGFVNVGSSGVNSKTEGVTIVGGHEWAETVTDEYPNGGWLDSSGAENGDKCAWVSSGGGASRIIKTNSGTSFAIQTLWSNADSGCVAGFGN